MKKTVQPDESIKWLCNACAESKGGVWKSEFYIGSWRWGICECCHKPEGICPKTDWNWPWKVYSIETGEEAL